MMRECIKVMLIEDNPLDIRLIEEILKDARDICFILKSFGRLSEAFSEKEEKFDIILLDLNLPDATGIETFKEVQKKFSTLPIVVLSGLNDERVAMEAVSYGAQDYLLKGSFDHQLLSRAIRYAIQRQKIWQELKEIDRLKSEFLSTVSHELRTPLTTIREGVSQVLDGILGDTTPRQREFLSIVLEDVDRLKRIIDDLLDISKIEAGKIELKRDLTDIVEIAQEVVRIFTPAFTEAKLDLKLESSLPKIELYIDKDKIFQVLNNLVGNALKFTPRGEVKISIKDFSHYIECSVQDSGVGIPSDDLDKVFDKFYQVGRVDGPGAKGTGLGLAITKGIVEMHKGKMKVESKVGEGSTFTFSLPKFGIRDIVKEHLISAIEKARLHKSTFSILEFNLEDYLVFKGKIGEEGLDLLIREMESIVAKNLRTKVDIIIRDERRVLSILIAAKKEEATKVGERIKILLKKHFLTKQLEEVEITLKVLNYPSDNDSLEWFLSNLFKKM